MERMTLNTGMRQNGAPFRGLDYSQVCGHTADPNATPTMKTPSEPAALGGGVGYKDKDERLGIRIDGNQSGKRMIAGTFGIRVEDVK